MLALISLLVLNVFMAAVPFCAGLFALRITIASDHMAQLSSLSSGILIGTALGVILPEGIDTLQSAHSAISRLTALGISLSFVIGASTLVGFITLYAIGKFVDPGRPSNSYSDLQLVAPRLSRATLMSVLKSTLTLSLLVHAAADGLALGVAFLDDDHTFRFLFVFMLIIHKVPTAFSLAVVLLKDGLPKSMCECHLAAFCTATPVTSLVSFVVFSMLPMSSFVVGILMLFSAGTFIYSVLHVMQESESHYHVSIASAQQPAPDPSEKSSGNEILLTICGMFVPLFLSLAGGE